MSLPPSYRVLSAGIISYSMVSACLRLNPSDPNPPAFCTAFTFFHVFLLNYISNTNVYFSVTSVYVFFSSHSWKIVLFLNKHYPAVHLVLKIAFCVFH